MLILHYQTIEGTEGMMLILEPANLEKMKLGKPITKRMRELVPDSKNDFEVCLVFTPDAVWVAEQIKKGVGLTDALDKSLTRPEVFVRPQHAEEVTRFKGDLIK